MSIRKQIFSVIICLFVLSSCNIIADYQQDSFYRNGSEWDHLRFPLIKPYYATYAENGHGWNVNLEEGALKIGSQYIFTIEHIQRIAVEKGVLMIYSSIQNSFDGNIEGKSPHWYVIIPEQNIQIGFGEESEFLTYIQQRSIQGPTWREPNDILHEYDQTKCLAWIPDCK